MAKLIGKIAIRFFAAFFTLLIIILIALLAVMWVLTKGPSPTAQRLFVTSVNETSAVYWLADIFLSEDEVAGILGSAESDEDEDAEDDVTDTSMITLPQPVIPPPPTASNDTGAQNADSQQNAAAGSGEDGSEDGDGLELFEIFGVGYRGYMLVVDDPLRIFVGTPDSFGGRGLTLMSMVDKYDAVAGINAGGFEDENGSGTGGTPIGLVITDGEVKWGRNDGRMSVMGFDADGILHVGMMTAATAEELGLQWAVSFGPTLVSNGVASSKEVLQSGINPRTAIGQRADGAVLMLVVEGRIIDSLGATYGDLAEIMLDFGAVNAANLDGGSSTMLMLNGEVVNICSSVAGPRPLPTTFLVR